MFVTLAPGASLIADVSSHMYALHVWVYTLTMNIYWLEALYILYGNFKTVNSFIYYWKKKEMTMSCGYTIGNKRSEAVSFPIDYTMAHIIIRLQIS